MNDLSTCRVLVIDDDEDARFLLQCLLEKLCPVETAADAAEGLASATQNPPDLILLDINLPGKDGFSVCRELRCSPATSHIPVVFITVSDDIEDMIRGFAAGGVDYIKKPFEIAEVDARVTAQLRQQLIIRERATRLGKLSQALAGLEQSYLFFADNTADVLVRCGPDGVVRHVNRQWARLSGLQAGSPIGRPVEEMSVDADRALVRAALEEAIAQGSENLRLDFSVPTPVGPCPARGSFLIHRDLRGTCVEINVIITDVSDILGTDVHFSANHGAVRAFADAHLAYLENVSHEIRSPLNGIVGGLAILQEERTMSPEAREAVEILSDASEKLTRLFETLLEARPSSNLQTFGRVIHRVLLVDDVPSNLKVLQLALRGLGIRNVDAVSSGEEGWRLWQESMHSLVLLDYRMDGMSGYELCRKIRSHTSGFLPTIVGVSANALPENAHLAKEAGFDAQISKPVSRLKLRSILDSLGVTLPAIPEPESVSAAAADNASSGGGA